MKRSFEAPIFLSTDKKIHPLKSIVLWLLPCLFLLPSCGVTSFDRLSFTKESKAKSTDQAIQQKKIPSTPKDHYEDTDYGEEDICFLDDYDSEENEMSAMTDEGFYPLKPSESIKRLKQKKQSYIQVTSSERMRKLKQLEFHSNPSLYQTFLSNKLHVSFESLTIERLRVVTNNYILFGVIILCVILTTLSAFILNQVNKVALEESDGVNGMVGTQINSSPKLTI